MPFRVWPPCARHDGRHMDVWGQCVHWGAPVALRPGICPEDDCRVQIMRRLDLTNGEVTTIEAGSDELHVHQAPVRVELDPAALGSAIVDGLEQFRQQRQDARPSAPARLPSDADPPRRPGERPALGGIPRLPT